jgi:DNA primase
MDLIEYLEENDIRVWTKGKNVSRNWIGLTCPFCADDSNHLGIKLTDYRCHCWKCGPKNLIQVLRELLDLSYPEAKRIVDDLNPCDTKGFKNEEREIKKRLIEGLPKEAQRKFPQLHLDYLRSRGFAPLKTIRKYSLRAVGPIGEYKFRIIIPVIHENRLITFTSRDVTDQQEPKYKAAPSNVYANPKHYVFGLNMVSPGDSCILVEGPFDVMKLGKGAISFFGVSVHGKQIVHLKKKKINTLHICFDNDTTGIRSARLISKQLFPLVKRVNIVHLTEANDPGALSREQGKILMNVLNINTS